MFANEILYQGVYQESHSAQAQFEWVSIPARPWLLSGVEVVAVVLCGPMRPSHAPGPWCYVYTKIMAVETSQFELLCTLVLRFTHALWLWLHRLPWGLERKTSLVFGKLLPWAVGDGAKVGTCLVPEKLEFVCFAFKQHRHIHADESQKRSSQTAGTPGLPHGCILFSWSCLKEELVTYVSSLCVSLGYEEWSWMTQTHVSLLKPSPGTELDPIFSACVSMEVWICHTFTHDNSQHIC